MFKFLKSQISKPSIRELAEREKAEAERSLLKEHSEECRDGVVSDERYPEMKKFVDLIVADCFEGCAFPTDD